MKRAYLLSIPLILACQQTSNTSLATSRSFLPMVPLDDRVAYVDNASGSAFLLDPAIRACGRASCPPASRPLWPRNTAAQTSFSCSPTASREMSTSRPSPPDCSSSIPHLAIPPASYDLPGRYDQLAQSDDGAFAVLYDFVLVVGGKRLHAL